MLVTMLVLVTLQAEQKMWALLMAWLWVARSAVLSVSSMGTRLAPYLVPLWLWLESTL